MSNIEEVLTNISKEYLTERGAEQIKELLSEGKVLLAKIYLLGAIDHLWIKKEIDDIEAAEVYKALDVPQEKALRVRQDSGLWK